MNVYDASLYSRHNRRQHAYFALAWRQLIASPVTLPPFNRVLDLGCGVGDVTRKLDSFLNEMRRDGSKGPRTILGIDSSVEMINFCRDSFKDASSSSSTRFDFQAVNFDEPFPKDWKWSSSYDLVTSHSALHYANNLSVVLSNVFDVLKRKGHFAFSLILDSAFNRVGVELAQKFSRFVPPNVMHPHNQMLLFLSGEEKDRDPAEKFRHLAEKSGLKIHTCRTESFQVFSTPNEIRGYLEPLAPHLNYIPEELKEEFLEELTTKCLEGSPKMFDGGVEKFAPLTIALVVHGEKP